LIRKGDHAVVRQAVKLGAVVLVTVASDLVIYCDIAEREGKDLPAVSAGQFLLQTAYGFLECRYATAID
jgi:hypothetical protein